MEKIENCWNTEFVNSKITNSLSQILTGETYNPDKVFVLVDENTEKHCFPVIAKSFEKSPKIIKISSGDHNKNLETTSFVWQFLSENGADRSSVLINLGGGAITDLGGFVASTFKRGIDFINIPTTLLAQIDAAIGGKNGINFLSLKNEIGVFKDAKKVLIFPKFLKTLPKRELISGYAEMVKHALIDSEESWQKIKDIKTKDLQFLALSDLIFESVEIKQKIADQDPNDKGIRHALNYGHTIGHAVETLLNSRGEKLLHGEAVGLGMICETFISNKVLGFDLHKMFEVVEYLAIIFPSIRLTHDDYEEIYKLMLHDKKNKDGKIRFALLSEIGEVKTNQTCSKNDIFQSLNFYFQLKK